MANSFSVLLSYINNLLWLCTQLFYMILYICKGFVQLWGLSVQAVMNIGNAIEFLAELPVRIFHLAKYLLGLAGQACMSWFWATLANSVKMLTAIFKNLGLAFISVWTLFHCVSFLKATVDSCVRVFKDLIEIVRSIANCLYDIINTLKEITTFLITMIDYLSQILRAFFESAAEGYSSISLFMLKNWGALLALALICITVVWVTNMRNIQNILQDLTQIVNSFTHSRPHEIDREQVRLEGHLHHDIHPQGQQQIELQDRNEGDEENGGKNPVESIMSDLKNRLSEEQEKQLCVVCQDAVKNSLFLPCRHLCACLPCADKIVSSEKILSRNCPLCRKKITLIVPVYS